VQIGAVVPQTEIGGDPGAVRGFAEAAEAAGYKHLLIYDHVLGADSSVHKDWAGPYTLDDSFHEPLTLFSWLAALTGLEFATGILIGPQRQTALLAKQAAELAILSGGRLRLGLGIGWNPVEYHALGMPFSARGRRLEEQIGLLRSLWRHRSVTFEGEFDTVIGAGLNPLPPGGTIPIWIGALAPPAIRRVGRVADGWFPQVRPGGGLEEALELIAEEALAAGRDPEAIGMESQVNWASGPEAMSRHAARWRAAGATHLSVNTMAAGCASVEDHIAAITSAADAVLER